MVTIGHGEEGLYRVYLSKEHISTEIRQLVKMAIDRGWVESPELAEIISNCSKELSEKLGGKQR